MSSFAAEGAALGPAHKIASKDIVVYDKDRRSGSVAKATIVEGLLAEAVSGIKMAVDVLYQGREDPQRTASDAFKVIGLELIGVIDMLSGYHDAALRPKHRSVRAIMVAMFDRMKANDVQDGGTDEQLAQFAKDIVAFLECIHVCMLESTDRKKRYRWKKRFLDG